MFCRSTLSSRATLSEQSRQCCFSRSFWLDQASKSPSLLAPELDERLGFCGKARSPTPPPWDLFFPLVSEWGRSLINSKRELRR